MIVKMLLLSEYFDIDSLTNNCLDFLQSVPDKKFTEEIIMIMRIENDLYIKDVSRMSM